MRVFQTSLNGIASVAEAIQVFGSGVSTGITLVAAGGRNGYPALRFTDRRGYLQVNLASNPAVSWVRLPVIGQGGECCLVKWLDGATAQVELWKRGDQRLEFRSNGSVIAVGTRILSASVFHVVTAYTEIHPTSGEVAVDVDGVTDIDAGGLDTDPATTAQATALRFGEGHASAGSIEFSLADLCINDASGGVNDGPPDAGKRVVELVPNGAGTTTDFTPSAGSNFQNVDEDDQDGDTTYNASSTVGHKDEFALPSLDAAAASVDAVSVVTWARKTDAGARTMRNSIREGGTRRESGDILPGQSYEPHASYFDTDPATAAWDVASVNALEVGYELQA